MELLVEDAPIGDDDDAIEDAQVGGISGEAGGHPDHFGVEGEVDEGAAFEFKDRFVVVTIVAVLGFGVFGGLVGEGIFKFEGDQGDAVEAEGDVDDAVFGGG